MVKKWDYETESYKDYKLPKKASLFEFDLDTIVQCAGCGRRLMYGKCYTSKVIHNSFGFGYGVCEDCYVDEREQERKVILKTSNGGEPK